ncbi:MAG: QueT transporter family protein [Thermodesulfobacteriota bacterium]|nr:QueT transporter family protein [Thermodesulfobacteriota bacterium]
MREVFTMWKYTKMVVLTALTAAIYASILIPFKGIPIIPGFTELRPANVVPVVFGLLFGPAAAWGSAFGNIIGDFFGTLSIASLFGFIGNFFFGFVGYKIWGHMGWFSSKKGLMIASKRGFFEFALVVLLSSMVCALIIAWGLELLGLFPFAIFGVIIALNNSLGALILGPFLLLLLYERVKRWDLLWTDIMDPEDMSPHISPRIGTLLMWIGGAGGLAIGIILSTGLYDAALFDFTSGMTGNMVVIGVAPFLFFFFIGCLLV